MVKDRVIDGKDIWPVLSQQPGAKSPHDRFFYHQGNQLRAVRSGPWKLYIDKGQPALYHLDIDIGESRNVAAEYPKIVARLASYLKSFEEELGQGDELSTRCRPAGRVPNAKPLVPSGNAGG